MARESSPQALRLLPVLLQDLLFTPPFPFQCLSALSNNRCLKERQEEYTRLLSLDSTSTRSAIYTQVTSHPTTIKISFYCLRVLSPKVYTIHLSTASSLSCTLPTDCQPHFTAPTPNPTQPSWLNPASGCIHPSTSTQPSWLHPAL